MCWELFISMWIWIFVWDMLWENGKSRESLITRQIHIPLTSMTGFILGCIQQRLGFLPKVSFFLPRWGGYDRRALVKELGIGGWDFFEAILIFSRPSPMKALNSISPVTQRGGNHEASQGWSFLEMGNYFNRKNNPYHWPVGSSNLEIKITFNICTPEIWHSYLIENSHILREFLFQTSIFDIHVEFLGCMFSLIYAFDPQWPVSRMKKECFDGLETEYRGQISSR